MGLINLTPNSWTTIRTNFEFNSQNAYTTFNVVFPNKSTAQYTLYFRVPIVATTTTTTTTTRMATVAEQQQQNDSKTGTKATTNKHAANDETNNFILISYFA